MCSVHFTDEMYYTTTSGKNLKDIAVPTNYQECQGGVSQVKTLRMGNPVKHCSTSAASKKVYSPKSKYQKIQPPSPIRSLTPTRSSVLETSKYQVIEGERSPVTLKIKTPRKCYSAVSVASEKDRSVKSKYQNIPFSTPISFLASTHSSISETSRYQGTEGETSPVTLKIKTPVKTYSGSAASKNDCSPKLKYQNIPPTSPICFLTPTRSSTSETSFSAASNSNIETAAASFSTSTPIDTPTGSNENHPSTPKSSLKFIRSVINLPDSTYSSKRKMNLSEDLNDTPQKKRLKRSVIRLRRTINLKRKMIDRLKKNRIKAENEKKKLLQETLSKLNKNCRLFVGMQLKANIKKKVWSRAERKFAMSLYYKSSAAYRYLRANGIVLPCPSTVKNWFQAVRFAAGLNQLILNFLKIKAENMSARQKRCIITFDEMSILKCFEYSKSLDIVEGFEDLGVDSKIKRKLVGTHGFVVMLRGLYSSWKFPLSYYITHNGMEPEIIKEVIEKTVEKTVEVGLNPKLLIGDQGPQNQKYYSKELKISPDCVEVEIAGNEIFCIFDPPHLMKSLRNNMLNGNFIDAEGKVYKWNDLRSTYFIDIKSPTGRLMPKITERHIKPNSFQRMSCKLALQAFSNAAQAAIKTAKENGQLESDTANNTAELFKMLNDLFDSLNSRNLSDPNPFRRPLSVNHMWHFELFDRALKFFQGLQKVRVVFDKKKNLLVEKKTRPPCFDGMIITIKGILGLYHKEEAYWSSQNNTEFVTNPTVAEAPKKTPYFLLTNRCSQDPLEHFFSMMRQNGHNTNPSAKAFRCRFGHISTMSLFKFTDLGNCQADDDYFLDLDPNSLANATKTENNAPPSEENTDDTQENDNAGYIEETYDEYDNADDDENPFELAQYSIKEAEATLETCANVYVAGYVAYECLNKFDCKNCKEILLDKTKGDLPDKQKIFLVFKTFENITNPDKGLKVPSAALVDVVSLILRTCAEVFNKTPQVKNIKSIIFKSSFNRIKKQYPKFLESINQCSGLDCQHLQFFMDLLIRTKIFKDCKRLNEELKQMSSKKNKKDTKVESVSKVDKDTKFKKLQKIKGISAP